MLTPGTRGNRLLRFGLLVLVALPSLVWVYQIVLNFPIGTDVDIPLRATERWLNGGQPYVGQSFDVPWGRDLPFLYPPFVLPFLAPLTLLPRGLVLVAGVALSAIAAVVICRTLAIPRRWWPLVLLWPPFTEGIWVANVQVVLVALFVAVFWRRPLLEEWRPPVRAPEEIESTQTRTGVAASLVAAIKVSQVHPWALLLSESWRATLRGALVVGVVIAATLPLTGLTQWAAWLDQARLAADPTWGFAGSPISSFIGLSPALVIAAASVLATLALPRLVGRSLAPAWVGLLVIVAAPNVHTYYFLFMLPAMLMVRREVALVAAALVATYWPVLDWVAVALIAGTLAGSSLQPRFLEPAVQDRLPQHPLPLRTRRQIVPDQPLT